MKPFVDTFLDFTKSYESPTSFFRWAAYTAVAAVLRNNVYCQQGHWQTYPSIYTLLLANSAVHRKSVPVILAGDLVTEVSNTKVIRGRSSIQAITDELGTNTTDRNTGAPLRGGSCLLCAEELASFFVEDKALIPMLTDMYDFHKEWVYSLKGAGKVSVKDMCVTMLAASNEAFLKEVYTASALYGGLLGRTFIIKPSEFRPGNSLLGSKKEVFNTAPLLNSLKAIAKLKGEVRMDSGVEEEYSKWYLSFRESYASKDEKTGVVGRMHTGILKIAMIIGLSRNYDLVVQLEDLDNAMVECLSTLPNYESFVRGQGKSSLAEASGLFLEALWSASKHALSRRDVLFKHWSDFDAETLDKMVMTLETAGMVQTTVHSQAVMYQLTAKAEDIFFRSKSRDNGHLE